MLPTTELLESDVQAGAWNFSVIMDSAAFHFMPSNGRVVDMYAIGVGVQEANGLPQALRASGPSAITCTAAGVALRCSVVPLPAVSIDVVQRIGLRLHTDSLNAACGGGPQWLPVAGSFTISTQHVTTVQPLMEVASALTTVASGIATAFTGSSPADVLLTISLWQSDCASALNRKSVNIAKHIVSPFIFASRSAAVLGNIGIIVLVWIVQRLLVRRLRSARRIQPADAAAAARYPAVTFGVGQLAYVGVAFNAMEIFSNDGSSAGSVVAAVAGLLYLLALPYAVGRLAQIVIVRFKPYTQFLSKHGSVRWLYPTGFYDPEPTRIAYSAVFGAYSRTLRYWSVMPYAIVLVVSVAAGGLPTDGNGCAVKFGISALVLFVSGLTYWIRRPLRSPAASVFTGMNYILLGGVCTSLGVSLANPDQATEYVVFFFTTLVLMLSCVRAIHAGALDYLESRHWMHLERNIDLEESELKSVTERSRKNVLEPESDDDDDPFAEVFASPLAQLKTLTPAAGNAIGDMSSFFGIGTAMSTRSKPKKGSQLGLLDDSSALQEPLLDALLANNIDSDALPTHQPADPTAQSTQSLADMLDGLLASDLAAPHAAPK